MKKHLIYLCTLCCVLLLASCKYDDDDLWSSLGELNDRVAALEKASQQAQADILALQTLTQKLSESVTVSSVMKNEDSYTINFSDGTNVTISNGTDGVTPPSLSVEEDNGIYYWVLISTDGSKKYLEDKNGQKIQANGRDGRSPQVRINPESGEWEISTEEGKWTPTGVNARGEGGDAYFSNVEIDGGYVVFTLKAGDEIRLPLTLELKISFKTKREEFLFGEKKVLPMEIRGAVHFLISKPDGWRAQFTGDSLSVTAPEDNEWAEKTGTISVVGFTSSGQSDVAEIEVSAGSLSEPANEALKVNMFTKFNVKSIDPISKTVTFYDELDNTVPENPKTTYFTYTELQEMNLMKSDGSEILQDEKGNKYRLPTLGELYLLLPDGYKSYDQGYFIPYFQQDKISEKATTEGWDETIYLKNKADGSPDDATKPDEMDGEYRISGKSWLKHGKTIWTGEKKEYAPSYGLRFRGTSQYAAYRWEYCKIANDEKECYLSIKIKALGRDDVTTTIGDVAQEDFWTNGYIEFNFPATGNYTAKTAANPTAENINLRGGSGFAMSSTNNGSTQSYNLRFDGSSASVNRHNVTLRFTLRLVRVME